MKTNSSKPDPIIQSKLWTVFFVLNPVVMEITKKVFINIKVIEQAKAENDIVSVERLEKNLEMLIALLESEGDKYLQLTTKLGFADVDKIKLQ